ncbi:phospholipase ABHD3-like [Ctenocephalides felis]|uniref:phospholipase ABHD3-like n=1 Tax=Ctenocephalides felis TaxID=7515 RepID=UPI000E6E34CA|nr:phospholipase ABHD3-like [Ctenocephalides felis]
MEWMLTIFEDMSGQTLFIACSIGYVIYYLCQVVKRPVLACSDGPFRQFLLRNVPLLRQKFWPTLWCVEARAQTVLASLLRSRLLPVVKYRREILTLADGGEIGLDWLETGCDPKSPVILILPGLTGESQAEYIKCLALSANSIGVRCVVFNNRGLAGVQLKTPRLYCAANVDDLSEVVEHVHTLNSDVQLGAVGISMGALLIGNYIATRSKRASSVLTAAMIISAPWNVFKGTKSIEKPYLNSMLGRYLASNLCTTLKQYKTQMIGPWDMDKVLASKTIKEFDENFTTLHFGYKNIDDYYSAATLHDKIDKITVPLLCLSAADDPFQPLDAIPIEQAENSSYVAIAVTARGGHIGFMDGLWPLTQNQYMARLFGQYFSAVFNVNNDINSLKKKIQVPYQCDSVDLYSAVASTVNL